VIELGPFAVSGFLVVLLVRYLIFPRLEKWIMTGEWFEQIVRFFSHAADKMAQGDRGESSHDEERPWRKSRK